MEGRFFAAERPPGASSEKKYAPACERNQEPILHVLRKYLEGGDDPAAPNSLAVLEVGSGSGQHAAYMSTHLNAVKSWQPTDYEGGFPDSVVAWTREIEKVKPPLTLDASAPAKSWPVPKDSFDVVYTSNVVHISPYNVLEGLMSGAGFVSRRNAFLFMYGPFKVGGKCTTPSNDGFDASLRAQDPSWGIRDSEDVEKKAAAVGFRLVAREEMPANNFMLVFKRTGDESSA